MPGQNGRFLDTLSTSGYPRPSGQNGRFGPAERVKGRSKVARTGACELKDFVIIGYRTSIHSVTLRYSVS